jgi:hypothetical protein
MSEVEEAIQIWKDNNISYAEFQFYCGGDSMGETEFHFYTEKGEITITEGDLEGYFDDKVYENVDFYVNSDGHYQGEEGVVHIELEDGQFTYSKSAQSEWSEAIETELLIELTKEQADFIRKNVSDINGGEGENSNFNYSRNFILTDKDETIQSEIGKILDDTCEEFQPDTKDEVQEWYNFQSDEVNDEDKLVVNLSNNVTMYTDSD